MAEISKPAKKAWSDLLRMIATSTAMTPDEVAAKVIEGAEIIQRAIDESHEVLRAGFETALACGDSQRERLADLKRQLAEALAVLTRIEESTDLWSAENLPTPSGSHLEQAIKRLRQTNVYAREGINAAREEE